MDHISLQYKRMGLTRASSKKAFSFSEYSVLRIQNIALEAFFDKKFLANEKEPEGSFHCVL
jgi:hypothetical protein